MNKEEFDILVNDILKVSQPKEEVPISAMASINVGELRQVIEAFNKIPDYNLLIKDNLKKDKEIERLKAREQECIDKYLAESKYRGEIEGKYVLAKYVIDELEKWLEEIMECESVSIEATECYEDVYNKLNTLKEGK